MSDWRKIIEADESLWLRAWFNGNMKARHPFDFRAFALLWKNKVPFFIEGATLAGRLFFPFGLMRLGRIDR